jgi:putative AlgH/UPF0301 family transcriptional regulator
MYYDNKILIAQPVITDSIFAQSAIYVFKHTDEGALGVILNPNKEVGLVGFGDLSQFMGDKMPDDVQEAMKRFHQAISNNQIQSVPLFMGGPIKTPGIFFLHGYEKYYDEEIEMRNNSDYSESQSPFEEKSEYDLGIPSSFDIHGEGESSFDDGFPKSDPSEEDQAMPFSHATTIVDGLYVGGPFSFAKIIENDEVSEGRFRFYTGVAGWGPGQLDGEVDGGAWKVIDADPALFFNKAKLNRMSGRTEGKKSGGSNDWFNRILPSRN